MFRKLHESGTDTVTITVDGQSVDAEVGESVAAVLLRMPDAWSRLNAATGARRAPYCMMGVCFECTAEVDGVPSIQTCLAQVRDGMTVVRPMDKRRIAPSNV
jgi:predicted molibdopterin-dependent oxidoreductase YjgC